MRFDAEGFGERLHTMRSNRDLTQAELAGLCGLTEAHLCHFERGRRLPNLANFLALAGALCGDHHGRLLYLMGARIPSRAENGHEFSYERNEHGVLRTRHWCEACKSEFTVTPAPDNPGLWADGCTGPECASYKPEWDVEHLFEGGEPQKTSPLYPEAKSVVRLDAQNSDSRGKGGEHGRH